MVISSEALSAPSRLMIIRWRLRIMVASHPTPLMAFWWLCAELGGWGGGVALPKWEDYLSRCDTLISLFPMWLCSALCANGSAEMWKCARDERLPRPQQCIQSKKREGKQRGDFFSSELEFPWYNFRGSAGLLWGSCSKNANGSLGTAGSARTQQYSYIHN